MSYPQQDLALRAVVKSADRPCGPHLRAVGPFYIPVRISAAGRLRRAPACA